MSDSATTTNALQRTLRTDFLSSAGTERTAFGLFCCIAVFALLLTTVLGTEPAPDSNLDGSVETLADGLLIPQTSIVEEPQSTVGGYRSGNQ